MFDPDMEFLVLDIRESTLLAPRHRTCKVLDIEILHIRWVPTGVWGSEEVKLGGSTAFSISRPADDNINISVTVRDRFGQLRPH